MYLLVSDRSALLRERSYYSVSGAWFSEVAMCFPGYATVTADNIDEILVYSSQAADDACHAKTASCGGFSADDSSIRIDYESLQDADFLSGDIRKRRYGFCKRNSILSEKGFAPSIIFVDDINEYMRIKNGKGQFVVNENLLARLTEMVSNNDWIGIVRCFPKADRIENDPIWNDPECLSKLTFALSKLTSRTYKNPRPEDIQRRIDNEEFFLRVSDRCIELEPYRSMHRSTLAYFLYDRYKKEYHQEDFEQAKVLYEDLIESSQNKFKEQYRYVNLLRKHYELPDNRYDSEAYKEFGKVIAEYESLINSYQVLSNEEKLAQKKNYVKALYQYVALHADRTFKRYWDVYFNKIFAGVQVKDYLINSNAIELLDSCEEKINEVLSIIPGKVDTNNINDKPSYFDVRYRKAQIMQSRGFIAVLSGKTEDEYLPFFINSSDIIDDLLKTAKMLKSQGARFLFPDYLKVPQAVNYCMMHKEEQLDKLFFKAKPWMMYEYGKIETLLGNTGHAVEIFRSIPDQDLCRNKAERLIERLENS